MRRSQRSVGKNLICLLLSLTQNFMCYRALQDDPKAWWSEEEIEAQVQTRVNAWNIDTVRSISPHKFEASFADRLQIVTFDSGGVSGHANHRAVSTALQCVGGLV
jgi:LmbE family N-acetylglucosaminyl deacetylase